MLNGGNFARRALRRIEAGALTATSLGSLGPHLTRYAIYRQLPTYVTPCSGRHLAISGSATLCEVLGLTGDVVEADYPQYDIRHLTFADSSFASVVSDQVLEHVEGDPLTAFTESARVVRPGGLVVHTTCFLNPVHGAPGDFWRFTPDALKLLAERAELEVVAFGGWGNMSAVRRLLNSRLRSAPVPDWKYHPLHRLATKNDARCPIVTWVVARKRFSDNTVIDAT